MGLSVLFHLLSLSLSLLLMGFRTPALVPPLPWTVPPYSRSRFPFLSPLCLGYRLTDLQSCRETRPLPKANGEPKRKELQIRKKEKKKKRNDSDSAPPLDEQPTKADTALLSYLCPLLLSFPRPHLSTLDGRVSTVETRP